MPLLTVRETRQSSFATRREPTLRWPFSSRSSWIPWKKSYATPASLSDLLKMWAARLHNPILDISISIVIIFKLRPARYTLLPLISLHYLYYAELPFLVVKHVALINKLQRYINWYATVSDAISTLVCTVSILLIYNNCTWFVRKMCNFFHLTECWLSSSEVSGLVASVISSPRLKTYIGEEQHTASGKYIILLHTIKFAT